MSRAIHAFISQVFRENSGRSLAALIHVFGDIDVADDAVQEAFLVALHRLAPTDAEREFLARGGRSAR